MASHQLHLALGTHRGRVRERNEDALAYHYPSDLETLNTYGALFIVADGVGGLSNGAEVADFTVRRLIEIYYHEPLSTPVEMLRTCISQVNAEIYREYHTKSATTLVLLLIRQSEAIVAHVGDSRAYHGRPNQLKLITQDHAAELIDPDGKPRRKLTRALGYRAHVEATISVHPIQKDDCFLLVTDGATRYFDTNSLYKLLSENPRDSVQRIIERSNDAGGMDNVTAIMLMVGTSLANESALSTHLRQLAQIGVQVEVAPDSSPDVPQTNRLPPLLSWLILGIGFMAGISMMLLAPKFSPQTADSLSLKGRNISLDTATLAYLEIGANISSFLFEADTVYFVQDIVIDDEIWICLYDSENERLGWLREADLPAYRLLN